MALYLGKDKIAGTNTSSIIGDTLPVGAVIDYDGTEVPANWELVEEEAAGSGLPEITDDTVVLSDIEDGIYICTSTWYKGNSSSTAVLFNEKNDKALLIKATAQTNYFGVTIIQAGKSFKINYANGVVTTSPIVNIQDNLTSTKTDEALSANQGKILNEKIEAIPSMIALSTKTTTSGGNVVRWGNLEAGVYYADQRDYTINTGDTSEVGYDMWSVGVSQDSIVIVTRDTGSTWNGKFNIITSTGNKQYTVTTEYFYPCIGPYFILHKGNEAMGYYTEQFFYQDGMSWRTFIETNPDIGFYDGGGQIGYGDPNDGLYLTVDSGRNHFVDATHLIQPRDYYVPISFEEDPITNIITFTTRNFEEGTFTALRGMSWREWLNSDYNTLSSTWEILSASIELNAAYTLTYANDTAVKPWEIISGGEQYSGSK